MPNPVFLSDSVYLHFGTSSATTGAATNADSTPTVTVAEDGTDMGYAPLVTNVATGLYKVQIDCTAANGFEAGRRYSAYVAAMVGGVTGRDGIGEWEVLAVDMNTALDAAITSRMASYTQPAGFLAATFPGGTIANTTNITAGTITTVSGNVNGSVGSVVGLTASNLDVAVSTRLAPTVAGRTLDVSAGGEAGIDWANIGSPTTAQNLSATNIDVDQVVASVTGAVGSVTGLTAANLDVAVSTRLAAASYTAPDNASISAIKTKTDFLPSATAGAAGGVMIAGANATVSMAGLTTNIIGNITGNLSGSVGSVTGSVGSVTGLTASNLDATISSRASAANLAFVQADTDDIQTRLPAALVGGRMDSSVGAMAANTVTASALAADAVNEIVAAVFANVTDGTLTFAEAQRLMASSILAILSGAVAGGTGTVTVRDVADTKDRFSWNYDANGNRTGLTIIDTAA